jgi:uncharacterized protein (TIGR02996 family)
VATDDFDDLAPTDPFRTLDPEQRLALHGERTGDDLLAAVLADPDLDEPRLVYGDWLLEREDPRGEFIQLQLDKERSPAHDQARWERERELMTGRIAEWCDPLFPALEPSSIYFQRGFLWRARTKDRTITLRDVIGHPMWRTIGDLESTEAPLIKHACLHSVLTLRTNPEGLGALASAERASRVTSVFLQGFGGFRDYESHWREMREEGAWAVIQNSDALANVRRLALYNHVDPGHPRTSELLNSRLGKRLAHLEYWVERCSLERWPELLADHPSLQRLAIHTGRPSHHAVDFMRPDQGGVVFTRDGSAWKLSIEIDQDYASHEAVASVLTLAGSVDHLELVKLGDPMGEEKLESMIAQLSPVFSIITVR